MTAVKLNLGAGNSGIDGFTPLDRLFGDEIHPLDYDENSVDVIRASHVLEHFPKAETQKVLEDWTRALKPGGVLKIAVPDFNYAIQNCQHPHFEGWVMGGQTDDNDYHHALFVETKLRRLLENCGLENIQRWESEIKDCAALPVSLNLMGMKPNAKETLKEAAREPRIGCALSMPRLGFNDNWGCIQAAFSPWNMPVRRHTGVWWERSLQNVLEDMLAEGFDYAVTVDYDTLFTAAQFNSLYETIKANPYMDAVCAVQPQRGSGATMFTPAGASDGHSVEVKLNQPVKANTGHFGLTIIRLSALRDVPMPWFMNVPGKDGSWRREAPGLVDADIYFWNTFKTHGHSLYMLPWVSIGHIETLVSRIDVKTGKNIHHYPADWIQENFGGLTVERKEK